jgi:hypothetical protein
MTEETTLTTDQLARAKAALDAWYANPGGSDYRHPDQSGWDPAELAMMHAALHAPTLDAALAALDAQPDPALSSPEQDTQNRALIAELRHRLR